MYVRRWQGGPTIFPSLLHTKKDVEESQDNKVEIHLSKVQCPAPSMLMGLDILTMTKTKQLGK